MESIKDIVSEMRSGSYGCDKCGDTCDCPNADAIISKFADRIEAVHQREIGELKGERKGILKANEAFAADNTRLRGEIAEKDAEIVNLNQKVYEHKKLLATSPIGVIYQLGICDQDGNVLSGVGILFDNTAERVKMPRVGNGDRFYVVPYKGSEVAE